MTCIIEQVLTVCKSKLCDTPGYDSSSLPMDEIFNGDHCRPFLNLRTAYQQDKFIKSNLPYVVNVLSVVAITLV